MSAWVLVIVLSRGAVVIDMPDRTACYMALNKVLLDRYVASAFCLTRVPGLDKSQ